MTFRGLRKWGGIVFLVAMLSMGLPIQSHIHHGPTHLIKLYQRLNEEMGQRHQLSVFYYNITNNDTLGYRHHITYNPASVIKLPILIEALRQIQDGELDPSQKVKLLKSDKMRGSGYLQYAKEGTQYSLKYLIDQMILNSDNTATKILIGILSKEKINTTIQNIGLRNSKLETSQLLAAEDKNIMSTYDMAKTMWMIERGSLLNTNSKRIAKALLRKQQYRSGIPKYLPDSTKIANKTGTLNHIVHDVGVVTTPAQTYIIAISVTDTNPNYLETHKVLAKISKIVFDWNKFEKI